jgi:Tfp pilus assembly protein PilF
MLGLIVLLTGVAFLPSLRNGFVNWDDYKNVVENPLYRGLGWANLRWMFTTFHMGHYQPLSWVSLGVDYVIWGMDPFGYHLTNLLLHAANSVVFYLVCLRLFGLIDASPSPHKTHALPIAAALSALFFAIHPLRVESVAWITERRDVLSGFFFLVTLFYYLKAATAGVASSHRRRWIALSLASYILSLLSKASGITLPLILLVLDVYPLRRLGPNPRQWLGPASRNVWLEKVPFLVFAWAAGIVALMAQHQAKAMRPLEQYDIASRIMQSFYAAGFYLWKTVLPFGLSPLYEIPLTPDPWKWSFLISGVLVIGITVTLFVQRRRWPAIFAGWIVYMILLMPTSGIAQSGAQLVADRYSYLSCMVWAVAAGGGFFQLWQLAWNRGVPRKLFDAVVIFATLVLVGLGSLTWRQTQVWHNSEKLWRHALSIDPQSYFAHNNLGNGLAAQGRLDEAMEQFQQALRINPNDADAVYNLGNASAQKGKFEEADEQLQHALQLNPNNAMAAYDLGNVRVRQQRFDEAIEQFQRASRIDPGLARANYNLAQLFSQQGKFDEAIRNYHFALHSDPTHVKARYYLAVALAEQGDFEGAKKEFQESLRLEPSLAEAHAGLARALTAQGKKDEAVRHYQEAVRLLQAQNQNKDKGPKK